LNQTHIDKTLRIRTGRLGRARRDVVEQGFDAFGVGIRNFGKGVVVGAVGALQTFRIVTFQIFADQRFRFFFVGLDEVERFGEGAHDLGDEGAPLLKVLMTLSHAPFAFIAVLGRVDGIVAHADLQKPPVRMWLFGIVTLIEMRFAELIDQYCPDSAWTKFLSEGRLQKANALLEERGRRNQKLHLLDCLQFSDKGQIIARNEDIRNTTVFTSRSQAEAAVKSLEQLRNNLAHAQDILTTDWHTIVQLCEFYHSTVT